METEENQIVVFDSTSSHLVPSANGTSQGNQVASEAPQKFPPPDETQQNNFSVAQISGTFTKNKSGVTKIKKRSYDQK